MINLVNDLFKKFLAGLSFGVGFCLVIFVFTNYFLDKRLVSPSLMKEPPITLPPKSTVPNTQIKSFYTLNNPYESLIIGGQQIIPPKDFKLVHIQTAEQFLQELSQLKPRTAFYFEDGTYLFKKPIKINQSHIMLLSKSKDPEKVVFISRGMTPSHKVFNVITVNQSGFVLDGITLKNAPNHIIQIRAENKASFPVLRNCIIEDGYQQLVKVSYDKVNKPENFSHSGIVEYCIFRYTQGIGPNYYIGGIDAHGIRNWVIRNNLFMDIASPQKRIAEHAIHIWNNTAGNRVEGNIIIDSDRGIGFGMRKSKTHKNINFSNRGGIIKGNFIYHSNNKDPFADTGIILEDSAFTEVSENYVYMEHGYRRAIEYRYDTTHSVSIIGNKTNKSIKSRNGGRANLSGNSSLSPKEYNDAFVQFIQAKELPAFMTKELYVD